MLAHSAHPRLISAAPEPRRSFRKTATRRRRRRPHYSRHPFNHTLNATYAYDANGNLTSGAGRSVTLTSYNLPSNITQGKNSTNFIYDANHTRIKQTTATQTSIYLNPRIDVGMHFEKEVKGSVTEYKHYIYGAAGVVGVYTTSSSASPSPSPAGGTSSSSNMRYFHQDHIGSIVAVTDDAAMVVARYAFDPWGKRILLAGDADATHHGFTGHEHLDGVGLIHMNGRVYDPVLGRFMSADPYIQAPDNLQSYNRFSYVWNNPLSATDPSGYFKWKSIRNIVIRVVAAVADVMGCGGYCSAAVGAYQGYKSGGLTGAIVGGIQGYVGYQMSVNYPLGEGGNILWGNVARGAAVNGAFGCASASAAGGDCGRGALSGAVGTVGAAYGLPGAIIAGCAAGKIGGGSCSEGALNAVGTYAVYSAVGYIARSSRLAADAIARVRYFNSLDEYSSVALGDTEYAGNFPGSKVGIEGAFREYGGSPMGKQVLGNLAGSGEYLNIVYGAGEPQAVGTVIIWDGLPRQSITLGFRSPADVLAHEIGHTKFGGGYQDFPGQLGAGPVGNVHVHENAWRAFKGQPSRGLYRAPGRCYNAYGGGISCP